MTTKRVSPYKQLIELIEEAIYIHQVQGVDQCIDYIRQTSDFKRLDEKEIKKLMDRVLVSYKVAS